MSVTYINPPQLPEIPLYRQVAVASGTRIVHIAGQVSCDADGNLVGAGDLAAQIEQSYANVAAGLTAAGGSVADLVDLTMFVTNWSKERMGEVVAGLDRAATRLGTTPVAPATLIGVAALDVPEHLVELKAVAVLD